MLMKKFLVFITILLIGFQTVRLWAEESFQLSFRIRPEGGKIHFICRARNISADAQSVPNDLLNESNLFWAYALHIPNPNKLWRDMDYHLEAIDYDVISPLMLKHWFSTDFDLRVLNEMALFDSQTRNMGAGSYHYLRWALNGQKSHETILLGFVGVDGEIHKPVVPRGSKVLDLNLGLVYHKDNPLEMIFLALNGTGESVSIGKPLHRDSLIVATSPTIDYRREFFLPEARSEQVRVEAGQVDEWRIPWQTVLDLIPPEDLEKIKAGGGDLDLAWRTGEFESKPLPLSLADLPADPREVVAPPIPPPQVFVGLSPRNYSDPEKNEDGTFTMTPRQLFSPKTMIGLHYPGGYRYYFRIHDREDGNIIRDIPEPERVRVEFDFSKILPDIDVQKLEFLVMLMVQEGYSDFVVFESIQLNQILNYSVVPARYRLYLLIREKREAGQTRRVEEIRRVAEFEVTGDGEVQRIPLQWEGEPIPYRQFDRLLNINWPNIKPWPD